MNCIKNKNLLKEVLLHSTLSLPAALNIIATRKAILLKSGVQCFPTIALVGEPGTGKTPTAKAIIAHDDEPVFFYEKPADVRKRLSENLHKLLLLDDYAAFKSSSGRDARNKILDEAIRRSFNGTGASLIITAEARAFRSMADSAKDRLIPIYMDRGLSADTELSKLVAFLQSSDDFHNFMNEVYNQEPAVGDLSHRLALYRTTLNLDNHIIPPKLAEMNFLYAWAMDEINLAWKRVFAEELSGTQIEVLKKTYITKTMSDSHTYESPIEEIIMRRAISKGFMRQKNPTTGSKRFRIACPVAVDICSWRATRGCELGNQCVAPAEINECKHQNACLFRKITAYKPESLVIDQWDIDAILIFPKNLAQYHRPYHTPYMLILPSDDLLSLLNAELEEYSNEFKTRETYFSGEKLRKVLFKENRIAAVPNEGKSYRYSLPYPFAIEGSEIVERGCTFVLLNDSEAEKLKQLCDIKEVNHLKFSFDTVEITRILKKSFTYLVIQTGEPGKSQQIE